MLIVEIGQERGQIESAGAGPRDQADPDATAEQPAELVHGLPYLLDGGERGPRIREDGLAHLRHGHRTAGAVQERLPQLPLELPDLCAHPGLRQMQPGGGTGEVGLLHHGDEVLQLPKFHNS